ncbi:SUMF1/EgtB/PvdO family nonheme iron enzyme [uncultured Sphaerochaeta sp.]|uniref:formylglycine-generating enzyme family protein n=1 Tax=uncultured Sphaerochaeta sp. TaxID=886478 RepID=UPI002A0A3208|nr:SUMF1/EgtB/PvdO family nonheme iron enzyme [uncultured Sphaerochaeta sp.]
MKKHIELPQVEEVKLPHILGLRPGIYIFTLLTIGILLIVFLLCFLPGIHKGGRYVNFNSPLSETGVYVDDVYLGGTPYQFFIASGKHTVVYEKGGIQVAKTQLVIDHPVFLTNIIHRHTIYEPTLKSLTENEKESINIFNLNEIARTSTITSFDEVTKYSPVFKKWAQDAIALGLDKATVNDSFALGTNFITSSEILSDANNAKTMLSEAGLSITSDIAKTALDVSSKLFVSADSKNQMGLAATPIKNTGKSASLSFEDFTQEGLTYAATSFVMGKAALSIFPDTNEAGVNVQTNTYTIATTPVSEYQWALFVKANPLWDKTNSDDLYKKGLVDEYYLSGITPSVVFATGKPIHNISFKAAEAFCDWLSQKTGKKVFIPSQEQWTLAAFAATDKPYTKTLTILDSDHSSCSAMLGGVWEFTDSEYIPLQRLTDYQAVKNLAIKMGVTTDCIVKGGSYQNSPSDITEHTVGAVSKIACGDLIGFRIAWEL